MIQITSGHLIKTYELLLLCAPFSSWELPPSPKVEFVVLDVRSFYGDYLFLEGGLHRIRISSEKNGQLGTLIKTMAHEMCHLKQELAGKMPKTKSGNQHNKFFNGLCQKVCDEFGYDIKEF